MPIAKKTNISISQAQKHTHLNMPILKRRTFQLANYKNTKFKCANHRHKDFNEPITKAQAFK